ncbi:hypothetical protein TrST_g10882 [Triparma strigata]|uniref:Uncharacterized protein n=1 Tax=Triparma strigata TaxID=1606541 RepID=A0A9W7DVP9_9STRA|nr:hypothetical protein TrST_g10882 [Triparma strigata]
MEEFRSPLPISDDQENMDAQLHSALSSSKKPQTVKQIVAKFDPSGQALPAAKLRKMSMGGGGEGDDSQIDREGEAEAGSGPQTPDADIAASPTNMMPYTPGTPATPNTPSVLTAGGFKTPQLLSKKAMALADSRHKAVTEKDDSIPVGDPSTRPPRPPPPVSPPPTFSKRHTIRNTKPAQKMTTLSAVECAAYDLFDSRVMKAVNGWSVKVGQQIASERTSPTKTPGAKSGDLGTPGNMSMSTPRVSTELGIGGTPASTPGTPPSPSDEKMYSALGDALWGGWRNFRDAVRDEAVNAAMELESEGKDINALIRQSEEQADMDAAAAAAAAVAVVSVTDACMPNALREATRAMNNAHRVTLLAEREKRLRAERGLERGIKERAKIAMEMDKKGEQEMSEGGVVALGKRLGAAEKEKAELRARCEGLVKELEMKDVIVGKLSRKLGRVGGGEGGLTEDMTNVTPVKGGGNHNAADSSYMSLSRLPQHIKNELVAIAKVAPDDSPLKTGEFWSWLERSPEKGSSKSVEMEVSQDEEGRREDEGEDEDEDFKTFAAMEKLGKATPDDKNISNSSEIRLNMDASFTSANVNGEQSPVTPSSPLSRDHSHSDANDTHDSILMSPTGLNHANDLAKGSADLKETLRRISIAMGTGTGTPGSGFVARNLMYDDEDEDESESGEEDEDEDGDGDGDGDGTVGEDGVYEDPAGGLVAPPSSKSGEVSPTPSLATTNAGSNLSDEAGQRIEGASKEDVEKEFELGRQVRALEADNVVLKELNEALEHQLGEVKVELEAKVEAERSLAVDMLTKKKQQNIGLENRCRELETERSKLQQLLTELNEGMETSLDKSLISFGGGGGVGGAGSAVGGGDFKAGYEKAKQENLVVLRNMSQDLDRAEQETKVANKEGQKWKKKMEEVMAREEEIKLRAAEQVKNVREMVANSGVVGEEMRRLRGDNFTLQEVIMIGCGVVFSMLIMSFLRA